MASLPTIYTIQASDAPQHTDRLREILQKLETENRISGFTVLKPGDDLSIITDNAGEEDLLLIVLTDDLEAEKKRIEDRFKSLKADKPGVKLAEVLVDNVVYDNDFITFPTDLRPIRDREDMDAAWKSIEESLKHMLPVKKKQGEKSKPKLNPVWVLLGVLGVFLVGWIIWEIIQPPPVDLVTVPEVIGVNVDEAVSSLRDAGLQIGERQTESNNTFEENLVIRTDPPAGRSVEQGASINLLISLGPEPVQVPDVAGMTIDRARVVLEREGLRFGSRQGENSDEIQQNRIIRTDPPVGRSVNQGTRINLFISLGPEPVEITGRLIHARANRTKCIHKRENNWNNGNPVHLWDCNAGSPAFKSWFYEAETGYIRSAVNPEKCIHKRENNWNNGNPVHLWDCDAGSPAFKSWFYEAETGYIRSAVNPEKCIHKRENNWNNGNPVHLWDCDAGSPVFKSWAFGVVN